MDLLEERIHKARLKPFDISFKDFEWVSNSDGTRWFFVMAAKSEENELSALLRLTNSTFATYRQPALYSEHKSDKCDDWLELRGSRERADEAAGKGYWKRIQNPAVTTNNEDRGSEDTDWKYHKGITVRG